MYLSPLNSFYIYIYSGKRAHEISFILDNHLFDALIWMWQSTTIHNRT